ncbi:possible flagellar motor switch protein (fliG) [Parvularcula bermudensis HTCC2503]|uniref:Flagellar motor switch protein FliG n=1 Tax=Parvularcula bermudensis (strain ATCC BAA-594 / HTCC2503 / KCTC 12087) TaxID=314260 RepID=E0THL2_PARBH|nr:FliG C-terminal domain-containing protein [Parvularcula bermudensis]ADM09308.1 possible flagellar motor switch protein (fliG) [Parvularcula bermudensis HTCC2503]
MADPAPSSSDTTSMPDRHPPSLRPAEKAAIVLALVTEKSLEKLKGRFPDIHRERLIEVAETLRRVGPSEQEAVLREFTAEVRGEGPLRGGTRVADRLASILFEDGDPMDDFPTMQLAFDPFGDSDPTIWDELADEKPDRLAGMLAEASPAIVSVILQHVQPEFGSEVLRRLEEKRANETMLHLAKTTISAAAAEQAVEDYLREELEKAGLAGGPDAEAILPVTEILNRLAGNRREEIIKALEAELPAPSVDLMKEQLLSFDALPDRLPRSAVPVVFREFDEKTVLTALRFAQDQGSGAAEWLLSNISQRLADQIREKVTALPSINPEDGEAAQTKVVCGILDRVTLGTITLISPAEAKES